ncbi:guanine deaminase [Cytophaga hutchinsonii]|nr:guanine deaminase [Cytophaga hutchinsonii]SFX27096.1 guanine deaminase [Cytophaga hutchinsonii ATCC 33406]
MNELMQEYGSNCFAVRGAIVYLTGDPFLETAETCLQYIEDGLLIIDAGKILSCGTAQKLLRSLPAAVPVQTYPHGIILPGFIDTHIHYVQTDMIGSYGEQLLDWLNTYTFPEELKFSDPFHCKNVAKRFMDQLLKSGTTTAMVFCAVYPESVNALFEEAQKINMRLIAGKVLMDRNAPEGLLDTVQSGYADSKRLIERWHGTGRLSYAITPRFAPTSSPEQLEAAGQLWKEHPTTYIQSHISENKKEVAWAASLFPERKNYLDIYHHYGLTGKQALYAHGVHLLEEEFQCCYDTGTSLAHCPTSNMFLGSGLFDVSAAKNKKRPVEVGLGTDVGAGTSFSMLVTLNEAYKTGQLRNVPLDAVKLLYLATLGGARALSLEDKIGTLEAGKEADFIVLNTHATSLMKERMERVTSIQEALFLLTVLGTEETVEATYVAGKLVYKKQF